MGLETLAIAALATSAVSTGVSVYQGQKAASQQKKAAKIEKQKNDLADARSRSDAIRQARIAYASAASNAEAQGVANSSSAQGGQGSIQTQLGMNLSFLDETATLNDQASQALGKAASLKASSAMWGDVAGFSMSVFSNAEPISKRINAVFKKK